MTNLRNPGASLFVERASKQWVVFDPDGNLWIVPATKAAWEDRQPFSPTEDEKRELEPVPGHYKYMLGLPF